MQLNLLIEGNLAEPLEKSYRDGTTAVTTGITSATDGLKTSLRKQVKSVGLSSRLANTWRGVVYSKGRKSISAAGLVYATIDDEVVGFGRCILCLRKVLLKDENLAITSFRDFQSNSKRRAKRLMS